MGERKGQNKYFPPDFDPQKHRSLDAYHGSHPLRERARKLHQGILIIRFEMPYNIWCDGCGNHIGMGVRYNAEKSKIGMYYTTPIYKFRMKCHLCDNYMEIKTDPANHDYVIISGARRKEQRWDPKDNEQIVTDDKNDIKKMASDAMYKLEHGADDKDKIKAAKPTIHQLTQLQCDKKDDYFLNKLARNKFRAEKKEIRTATDNDASLLKKSSLNINLVKEQDEDKHLAKLLKYRTITSYEEKEKLKKEEIATQSIFHKHMENSLKSPDSSSSSHSSSTGSIGSGNTKEAAVANMRKKLGLSLSKSKLPTFDIQNTSRVKHDSVNNTGIVRCMSDDTNTTISDTLGDKKIVPLDTCDKTSVVIKETKTNKLPSTESVNTSLSGLIGDYSSSDSDNSNL